MTNNRLCIIEGCGREIAPNGGKPRGFRGLCKRCSVTAVKAVKLGKVTSEQLVEMGLMLPPSTRRGRYGPRSPFSLALTKALEGK